MARTRDFPFLFLLPLILGCFLSTSRAEEHPHKVHRGFESDELITKSVFREAPEQVPFATEDPITEAHYRNLKDQTSNPTVLPPFKSSYRGLQERRGFAEEEAEDRYEYREARGRYGYKEEQTNLGFRKNLVNEIRDVLDAFDKTYLANGQCEKLKDKMSKVLGFLRVALDFVN